MLSINKDELSRKEFLIKIFEIFDYFGNQDGQGLTMAINGKYGMGKSTLLGFIKQNNETDNKYNIVLYDAWKHNMFENPIVPLMYNISQLSSTNNKLKEAAKKVVKSIPMMLAKTFTNVTNIDISSAIESFDIFKQYDEFNRAIDNCKNILTDICKNKKTILLVDELDRCLPKYQIKVLELLYHFFNIPKLIVVVALDREQLEEAIRSEFGDYTDTYGYLSKFIQYEIDLPKTTIPQYAIRLMNFISNNMDDVKDIISMMIDTLNISTRDMQIIIRDLNLICKEKRDGVGRVVTYEYYDPIMIAFLLLLKTSTARIYKKYFGKVLANKFETEVVSLDKTRYYAFLQDIRHTKFNRVITVLQETYLGQAALLHIISLFDNIKLIESEGLASCVRRSIEDVRLILSREKFMYWYFPSSVNAIIKQLETVI